MSATGLYFIFYSNFCVVYNFYRGQMLLDIKKIGKKLRIDRKLLQYKDKFDRNSY